MHLAMASKYMIRTSTRVCNASHLIGRPGTIHAAFNDVEASTYMCGFQYHKFPIHSLAARYNHG